MMDTLTPANSAFWYGVGVAIVCGALVGLERQIRGKPAGIRTSILICMGTQLFVQIGSFVGSGSSDPSRVLGQIVTGIGFLGAGVILTRGGIVEGVTSASVIWILAATGALIGIRHYSAALTIAVLTVAILSGVEILENRIKRLRHGVHTMRDRKRGHDER